MKAAVINQFGEIPSYQDFADPLPGKGETLIEVKASALENFDKLASNGVHYSSQHLFPKFPAIVGHGGIGMADGQLVAFAMMPSPYGSFAEKAVAKYCVPVPEGVDPAVAAALPASVLTSFLPLRHTAKLEKGETVLVNGATGVSGRVAVQLARLLGAGQIIATGRNDASLKLLKELGADITIDLKQSDEKVLALFEETTNEYGLNVVLDFVWGRPAELLMKSVVPKEVGFAKRRIRYVQIGEAAIPGYRQKASSGIVLTGEMLRTSGLELYGVGTVAREALADGVRQTWEWIKANKFYIEIEKVPLADIETAWQRNDLEGKRIVIVPEK